MRRCFHDEGHGVVHRLVTIISPAICKVHRFAVAGGSDIALCADTVVTADDAEIGSADRGVGMSLHGDVGYAGSDLSERNGRCLAGDKVKGSEAEKLGAHVKILGSGEARRRRGSSRRPHGRRSDKSGRDAETHGRPGYRGDGGEDHAAHRHCFRWDRSPVAKRV
jgi:hypothetical protein